MPHLPHLPAFAVAGSHFMGHSYITLAVSVAAFFDCLLLAVLVVFTVFSAAGAVCAKDIRAPMKHMAAIKSPFFIKMDCLKNKWKI
jgi:hypothetical protein